MGSEYSDLKSAWWLLKDGALPDAPKHVHFVISDTCSQSCSWCSYRWDGYTSNELFTKDAELSGYGHNNPKRMVPTHRAMSLLDEMRQAGVQALQFTGGGEPLVHPDHEKIFSRALELGFSCALVSNGARCSDELLSSILPRFSWVRISIDAGNAKTYSDTRRTPRAAFDRVVSNVAELSRQIEKSGSDCALGVGWVVTPQNYPEIIEGVRMAKTAGAHNIRLSALFSPDDEKPYIPIYGQIKTLIEQARAQYEDDTFTIHDRFGERLQDLIDGKPDYKSCHFMRYTTYVGGDLNNYVCCVYSYNSRGLMTNLKDRNFAEWWKSDERKAFMDNFDARGCERCMFNDKNRALNYLVNIKPRHVEFP